ncbi:MAG: nitronate monooxygenase, partial [Prevotella sp.]|nr:nitronate monooxygenase [Prevotella sp.]
TAFAVTQESSAHDEFKRLCVSLDEQSTMLSLKQLSPTRLVKNKFYDDVVDAERRGVTNEEMLEMIGFGRARRGMLEGDLENGELEIGQVVAQITDIPTVSELMRRLVEAHDAAKAKLSLT